MRRAWSYLSLLVAFAFLLALQWPFKKIADALDGPIDRMQDRAETLLRAAE